MKMNRKIYLFWFVAVLLCVCVGVLVVNALLNGA